MVPLCDLDVVVLDHADVPFDGPAQLWRIGLPEDEVWTAGDELVARLELQDGGLAFQGLEPGTYRIEVGRRAAGSEPLPAFDVAGAEQREVFHAARVQSGVLRCVLLDLTGEPLKADVEFSMSNCTFMSARDGSSSPSWANKRRLRQPEPMRFRKGGVGCGRSRQTQAIREGAYLVLGQWAESNVFESAPSAIALKMECPVQTPEQAVAFELRWQGRQVQRLLNARAKWPKAPRIQARSLSKTVRIPRGMDLGDAFAFQTFVFEASELQAAVAAALEIQFEEPPHSQIESPLFGPTVERTDLHIEITLQPKGEEPYNVRWYPARGPLADIDFRRPPR